MRQKVVKLQPKNPNDQILLARDAYATQSYAVVATSYAEKLVGPDGATRYDRGYFTAVAEAQGGHWTFRDAHWSSVPASASH